jgi:hypothetical protein
MIQDKSTFSIGNMEPKPRYATVKNLPIQDCRASAGFTASFRLTETKKEPNVFSRGAKIFRYLPAVGYRKKLSEILFEIFS